MANLKFEIKGANKLLRELAGSSAIVNKWVKRAMHVNVLDVKKLSMQNTPVDTGNLRASARSRVWQNLPKTLGEVWYNANYAVYVHEKTWTRLRSGRHKFLEHALYISQPKIKRTYVNALNSAFKEAFK